MLGGDPHQRIPPARLGADQILEAKHERLLGHEEYETLVRDGDKRADHVGDDPYDSAWPPEWIVDHFAYRLAVGKQFVCQGLCHEDLWYGARLVVRRYRRHDFIFAEVASGDDTCSQGLHSLLIHFIHECYGQIGV